MDVTLGRFTVTLKKPGSFTLAREVTMAVGTSAIRGLGAALGACWGGKALKAKYAYDALAYGGAVVDELMALGVPEAEIYAAGKVALDLVIESLPREEAVAQAEGFSEAQTEG